MGARTGDYRLWGSLEEIRLEELRMAGSTVAECAQLLGRSHASVKCRTQRLGCWKRRNITRYLAAALTVTSLREQARLAGCSVYVIKQAKQRLRALGWDLPYLPRRNQYGICGGPMKPPQGKKTKEVG